MTTPETEPKRQIGCAGWMIVTMLAGMAVVWLAMERAGCGPCSNLPRTFTGQVVDENGVPVPGANVILNWSTGRGLDPTKGPSDSHEVVLTTDASGRFAGKGSGGWFGVDVRKEGYYPTTVSMSKETPGENVRLALNTMRRPQAMIGKQARIELPGGFSRLNYDLLIGDYLPPHGAGVEADLVIEWRVPDIDKRESSRDVITVRVPGEGNGVVTQRIRGGEGVACSRLKSWHEAPESGYVATFAEADAQAVGVQGEYYGTQKIRYLKIRSGRASGPLFAKMLGDVRYSPNRQSNEDVFHFEYVLNPSGDRGMEIDMKRVTIPSRLPREDAPEEF